MNGFVPADAVVCLVTCPEADAARIAEALVEGRFAACVNVVDRVSSTYRWEGEVERDTESLLFVKTTAGRVAAIDSRLAELHPYDNYELVSLSIQGGSASYLEWIVASTA